MMVKDKTKTNQTNKSTVNNFPVTGNLTAYCGGVKDMQFVTFHLNCCQTGTVYVSISKLLHNVFLIVSECKQRLWDVVLILWFGFLCYEVWFTTERPPSSLCLKRHTFRTG